LIQVTDPSALQREKLARTGALAIQRCRVDHEHVFEQRAQPGFPAGDVLDRRIRFD
jgi:predicted Rdx family selenoprotein